MNKSCFNKNYKEWGVFMENNQDGNRIKESERQSWGSLAMIWVGSMICVPCIMVGGFLASSFNLGTIALCTLIGYAIVSIYMCFIGMQGCDTGLSTVPMSAAALGEKGAQVVIGLILTISCIGWFGVQSAVCGSSFSAMIAELTGLMIPHWISSVFWGLVMLLTAMYGYNALKYLNYIAVPALAIVLVIVIWKGFTSLDGINVIKNYQPDQSLSMVSGISMVLASFALAGVISADYCRYAKSRGDVIKSSLLGVLPAGFVVILIGAFMSIITGQYDITAVLSSLGLPVFGLITLILATWTTNVANAYSGGLAVANMLGLGQEKFKMATGIAGLIGTIMGAVGILSRFQDFLSVLTSFIPPVAGVIIANYWILNRGKPENFRAVNGVNPAGLVSFVLGAAVAYITGNVYVFFLSPINGIIVSMVTYLLLVKVIPEKKEAAEKAAEY